MRLIIANKLYSSWSMRPWLIMRWAEIPFEETVIPLRRPETKSGILKYSPSGKVPVLLDGDVKVWDSLAIISYLDWRFPEKHIFSEGARSRAHELSICHEMHSGFQALRRACPMNLGKRFVPRVWDDDVLADVARIEALFEDTWKRFSASGGTGGLFDTLGPADAMFAPVLARLDAYQFNVSVRVRNYIEYVLADSDFMMWQRAALDEPWRIPDYEEGHVVEVDFHEARA